MKNIEPIPSGMEGLKVTSPMACDFLQRWTSLGAIKKCRDHTIEAFYTQHQVRNRAKIVTLNDRASQNRRADHFFPEGGKARGELGERSRHGSDLVVHRLGTIQGDDDFVEVAGNLGCVPREQQSRRKQTQTGARRC